MEEGTGAGIRVLLVEDESLVSMLAEDMLLEAGYQVRLAMRLDEALAAAEDGVDCAILDVNLGDGATSYPVAQRLDARGIPFVFASGYGAAGLPAEFRARPVVQKPYARNELLGALEQVLVRG